MKKFLCLQRTIPGKTGMDSDQMKDMYAKFEAWNQTFRENITDVGGGLGSSKIETAESVSSESLPKIKELTEGYMIITAESMDEAARIVRECPGLISSGSACEIIEIEIPEI